MSTKKNGITPISGSNFQAWKFQLECLIAGREYGDLVYSKHEDSDSEDTAKKALFVKRDAAARALLAETIEQKVIPKIINCKTAHEMWNRLKGIYEKKGDCNLDLLINEFGLAKMQEGEDVSSYIGRMEEMSGEIRSQGEIVSERWLKARIVGCLSKSFDMFSRVWSSTSSSDKTMEHLIDRLIQDERKRKGKAQDHGETALYSQTKPRKETDRRRSATPEHIKELKKNTACNNCQAIGHWAYECRRPKGDRKTPRTHDKEHAPSIKGRIAFMTIQDVLSEHNTWYADSAASSHMTKNRQAFSRYEELGERDQITILTGDNRNKTNLKTIGKGTVCFERPLNNGESTFDLVDVLHVPNLSANLVSIAAAIRKGLSVRFKDNGCSFASGPHVFASGDLVDNLGLFKLNIRPVRETTMLLKTNRTQEEWHKSLGHINLKQLSATALEKGL